MTPTEPFASPLATVNKLARDTLPVLVALVAVFAALQVFWLDHIEASWSGTESAWARTALLGTGHVIFVPLSPIFLVVSTGLYAAFSLLVQLLVSASAFAWSFVARRTGAIETAADKVEDTLSHGPSHWLGLADLVAFVLFIAPQQFAFLIVCLIHLLSTIRSLVRARRDHVRRVDF